MARGMYVASADQILETIPGRHHGVIDTWPKWSSKRSPPIPGGLYPNPKYIPAKKSKGRTKAKQVPSSEKVSKQHPAIAGSGGKSTLVDKTVPTGRKGQIQMVEGGPAESKGTKDTSAKPLLKGGRTNRHADATNVEGGRGTKMPIPEIAHIAAPLSQPNLKLAESVPIPEPLSSTAARDWAKGDIKGMLVPPTASEVSDEPAFDFGDEAESVSSGESLDLDLAMAEIKGLRPEVTTIGNGQKGVHLPAGIAKELSVMGGYLFG